MVIYLPIENKWRKTNEIYWLLRLVNMHSIVSVSVSQFDGFHWSYELVSSGMCVCVRVSVHTCIQLLIVWVNGGGVIGADREGRPTTLHRKSKSFSPLSSLNTHCYLNTHPRYQLVSWISFIQYSFWVAQTLKTIFRVFRSIERIASRLHCIQRKIHWLIWWAHNRHGH